MQFASFALIRFDSLANQEMRPVFAVLLASAYCNEDVNDGIVPDVVYHVSDQKTLEVVFTGA